MTPQQIASVIDEIHKARYVPIPELMQHFYRVYALSDAAVEAIDAELVNEYGYSLAMVYGCAEGGAA